MRGNLLPLVFAVLFALLGVFFMNGYVNRRVSMYDEQAKTQYIWIMAVDEPVSQGEIITPEMLKHVRAEKDPQPWSTIKFDNPKAGINAKREFDELVASLSGRTVDRNLKKGELLLWTDFAENEESSLGDMIQGGRRGVAVDVDRSSTMSGLIQPNDRVDVVATYKTGPRIGGLSRDMIDKTEVILEDVPILAVGSRMARGYTRGSSGSTVVLALTPDQALLLSHVQKQARISLLLRPRQDLDMGEYSRKDVNSTDLDSLIRTLQENKGQKK